MVRHEMVLPWDEGALGMEALGSPPLGSAEIYLCPPGAPNGEKLERGVTALLFLLIRGHIGAVEFAASCSH